MSCLARILLKDWDNKHKHPLMKKDKTQGEAAELTELGREK